MAVHFQVHAAQQLCGVTLARLTDFVTLLGLGEINVNASIRVRNGLTLVLKQMDEQDTLWAVEMSLLSGDLSLVRSASSPLPSPHTRPSPPVRPRVFFHLFRLCRLFHLFRPSRPAPS